MPSILNWSTTPGDNATADPDINYAEGQLPSTLNNSSRQAMARVAALLADQAPIRASTGSVANSYSVTLTSDHASYANKQSGVFRAHQSNTGACSINVNGWGIKALRRVSGQELEEGEIESGYIVRFHYVSASDECLIEGAPFRGVTEADVPGYLEDYLTDNADAVRTLLRAPITVASAVTTGAPSGAVDGTRYIVPSGATGSTWGSNAGKIAVASGGSWTYLTPAAGWAAFATDTDTLYVYDTEWAAIRAAVASTSDLQVASFKWVLSNGTDGGKPVDETWTAYTLNTTAKNTITGCSINTGTGVITLPAGTYLAIGHGSLYENGYVRLRIQASSAGTLVDGVSTYEPPSYGDVATPPVVGAFTLASSDSVTLQYYVEQARNSLGLGRASTTVGSGSECFASITLLSLASYQGPQGDDGDPGADGAGYLASSSSSLPMSVASKTVTTSAGLAYRAGDNVRIARTSDPTNYYMRGKITSYSTTSMIVNVTDVVGTGTYDAWTISLDGEEGAAGAAGTDGTDPGIRWRYDSSTTTNADPGTGDLRLNNASLASVTEIAISYSTYESGNPSVETWVKAWDDSTNTAHYGSLLIKKISAPENFAIYRIASVITDGTTYGRFTLADAVTSGSLSDNDVVSVQFIRSGNKGADGAGSGSVTSVDLSLPAEFTVSGSPVTSSGTLTASKASQSANRVWAGPTSGSPAAPAFRALVNADFPASGVSAGTYGSVTVDAKGLVTAGTNPTYTMTVQKFTSSAAWNMPTGCRAIKVTLLGAGGGGGSVPLAGASTASVGGGGGAGTMAQAWVDVTGLSGGAGTVTISNASPGVVTKTTHGFLTGQAVVFTTTGALPTGITAGQTYYVLTVLSADTFTISATSGGTVINTSSAGSGTHTCTSGASVNVTIGAGGAGGTTGAPPVIGSAGAASSFGSYLSAPGGAAGAIGPAVASTGAVSAGGAGGGIATASGATLFGATTGAQGQPGLRLTGTQYASGAGGCTPYGNGGHAKHIAGAGNAGTGYGSGGGGAASSVSAASAAGGAGASGLCVVEEYY